MRSGNYRDYLWLINTIYMAGRITLSEIDEKWRHSAYNEDHSNTYGRRRFIRHKDDILCQFGIEIECERGAICYYYIANTDEIESDYMKKWLLNSFAIQDILHESKALRERIIFEDIPSGHRYLTAILDAMQQNVKLEMTYQGYTRPEPHTFLFSPYCLKVFKQRWYVVGQTNIYPKPRIYSLDRICALALTNEPFLFPKDFHANDYFSGYYGPIRNEQIKPQQVSIRVQPLTANYLRSLPLHHSQKELECTDQYSIFAYYLAPTFDFIQELRTHGSALELLQPAWLRKEFKKDIQKAARLYR